MPPKTEQIPYVHIAVLHEHGTGLLVGVSPVHMTTFHETEADHTVIRFVNGDSVLVEEDLYEVVNVFREGQKVAPLKRRLRG